VLCCVLPCGAWLYLGRRGGKRTRGRSFSVRKRIDSAKWRMGLPVSTSSDDLFRNQTLKRFGRCPSVLADRFGRGVAADRPVRPMAGLHAAVALEDLPEGLAHGGSQPCTPQMTQAGPPRMARQVSAGTARICGQVRPMGGLGIVGGLRKSIRRSSVRMMGGLGGFRRGSSETQTPRLRAVDSQVVLHITPAGSSSGPAAPATCCAGAGGTWTRYISDEGVPYFHNEQTGETAWEVPAQASSQQAGAEMSDRRSRGLQIERV